MRKIILLSTFFILLIINTEMYSQVLTPNPMSQEITEYSIYTMDNFTEDHSAKIVKWNDKYSVVLNTLTNNNQATFGLLKKGNVNTSKTVYIPIEYKINDFTILNDTLYFVGKKLENSNTVKGIIGYVRINDLFNNSNQTCNYAEIRSTYNLFKVEAYNDSNEQTIVVAIGRQFYGEPFYIEDPDTSVIDSLIVGPDIPLPPNANIVPPTITGENQQQNNNYNAIEYSWSATPPEHRECLATLNIKRTVNGVKHKYDLWHLPYKNNQGKIKDLCLTKDFISVITAYYEDENCPLKNELNIYWFDKNNLENRWAKRMKGEIHSFSDSLIRGELETICTGINDIAICYEGFTTENCNMLYKLKLDTNTITPIFSHAFALSGNNIKHKIWDLEYIETENMLVVLKQSNIFDRKDEVWHLSMNDNIIMPYYAYIHTKMYDNLSSLELYDNIYLGIYGEKSKNKILIEKLANAYNSLGKCYDIREEYIFSELLPKIIDNPLMVRCQFAEEMQIVNSLLHLPAFQYVDVFNVTQTNLHTIESSCENIETNIIYKQPKTIE